MCDFTHPQSFSATWNGNTYMIWLCKRLHCSRRSQSFELQCFFPECKQSVLYKIKLNPCDVCYLELEGVVHKIQDIFTWLQFADWGLTDSEGVGVENPSAASEPVWPGRLCATVEHFMVSLRRQLTWTSKQMPYKSQALHTATFICLLKQNKWNDHCSFLILKVFCRNIYKGLRKCIVCMFPMKWNWACTIKFKILSCHLNTY